MPYQSLRADCVIETIDTLSLRIIERFPDSGLSKVCEQLCRVARRCAAEAQTLTRPVLWIRALVIMVWLLAAAAIVWLGWSLDFGSVNREASMLVGFLEPAMNLAVLVGIGVFALAGLEERWKRARAMRFLHELRSIAHVVDMHQLTKDPNPAWRGLAPTAHSPARVLPAPLLERYLDYCSEMVSLTGKLAALFAQSCPDSTVAAAASDIETLTTGLSRKMWQKITIIDRAASASANTPSMAFLHRAAPPAPEPAEN